MRILFVLLILSGCQNPRDAADQAAARREARALDNAAAKIDAERESGETINSPVDTSR